MKTLAKVFRAISLPLLFELVCLTSGAQQSDRPVTTSEQKLIVDKAFSLLKANYIFPTVLPTMEKEIYKKISDGYYAKFQKAADFLRSINSDLERLSNDRHIDIFFDPITVKEIESHDVSNDHQFDPAFVERAKYENYMVKKVERLDGNIGYLKFNAFIDTALSGNTLSAAMDLIYNSSAVIIDLRQNGGGDAATCNFLLGYLLPDSTMLMERKDRGNRSSFVYVSSNTVTRKFNADIPLYILTSKRTSSAAEAFAYTLQSYKRAIIIGDTTNGEANPGHLFSLNKEMYIMIPTFENINPVTRTNWQSKGVIPDLQISSEKAFALAEIKACESLARVAKTEDARNFYTWVATGLAAEIHPVVIEEKELKSIAGEYADTRHIIFSSGALFYCRGENVTSPKKMLPLDRDLFAVEGIPYFRVHILKNDAGKVTAMEGIYDDGKKDSSIKLPGK